MPSKALVAKRMKLYAALVEIADTERKYADDLGILVLIFFENLTRSVYFAPPPSDVALAADDEQTPAQRLAEHQVTEQRWKVESVTRNAEAILRLHQLLSARLDKVLADCKLLPQGPHRRAKSATLALAGSTDGAQLHASLPALAMSPALDQAVIEVAHELVKIVRAPLSVWSCFVEN